MRISSYWLLFSAADRGRVSHSPNDRMREIAPIGRDFLRLCYPVYKDTLLYLTRQERIDSIERAVNMLEQGGDGIDENRDQGFRS
jgi:hypothetical protein